MKNLRCAIDTGRGAGGGEPGDVRIESFRVEMIPEVSQVLARAFVTNPLNMAAFGRAQLMRNEAFFQNGLAVMKGLKWVAVQGSHVVGFIHWVQSPACQLPGGEKLKTIPSMLRKLGLLSSFRLGKWLSIWEKHDPKSAHLHLGPIGVDPNLQRRHVGRLLMEQYCLASDQAGIAGYLETDRPENVKFYSRFGFETVEEVSVLGVRNFLMHRPANSKAGERPAG